MRVFFSQRNPNSTWIMKPVGSAQVKGAAFLCAFSQAFHVLPPPFGLVSLPFRVLPPPFRVCFRRLSVWFHCLYVVCFICLSLCSTAFPCDVLVLVLHDHGCLPFTAFSWPFHRLSCHDPLPAARSVGLGVVASSGPWHLPLQQALRNRCVNLGAGPAAAGAGLPLSHFLSSSLLSPFLSSSLPSPFLSSSLLSYLFPPLRSPPPSPHPLPFSPASPSSALRSHSARRRRLEEGLLLEARAVRQRRAAGPPSRNAAETPQKRLRNAS